MYGITINGHLDVFKIIIPNVISSSYYDVLITKLQLQAMTAATIRRRRIA
ncbi:MAG: hypothetical protein ACJ704_06120 [Nitrososphaeraceae archaeon]